MIRACEEGDGNCKAEGSTGNECAELKCKYVLHWSHRGTRPPPYSPVPVILAIFANEYTNWVPM